MKTPIEKMQALQEKMDRLKIEQDKIEQGLVNHLVQVLKMKNAFQFDFNTLLGGLLEVIEAIKTNAERKEIWRDLGSKFFQSRLKPKLKRLKTRFPLEKNLDSN